MSLRPYKFIVQAVVQQVAKDGTVTGEQTADPVVLYGCLALENWAVDFPDKLAGIPAEFAPPTKSPLG